jgi:hypothetical protein
MGIKQTGVGLIRKSAIAFLGTGWKQIGFFAVILKHIPDI